MFSLIYAWSLDMKGLFYIREWNHKEMHQSIYWRGKTKLYKHTEKKTIQDILNAFFDKFAHSQVLWTPNRLVFVLASWRDLS